MTVLLVIVGGAAGAVGRVGAELALQRSRGFPWGTLLVNVIGAFILGVVLGLARDGRISEVWVTLVGIGFCGALTTFSGFAARLDDEVVGRRFAMAAAYGASTLVLGLPAAAIGFAVVG